jgi:hypothetical protein
MRRRCGVHGKGGKKKPKVLTGAKLNFIRGSAKTQFPKGEVNAGLETEKSGSGKIRGSKVFKRHWFALHEVKIICFGHSEFKTMC